MHKFTHSFRINVKKGDLEEVPNFLVDRMRGLVTEGRATPMGRYHQGLQRQQSSTMGENVMGEQAKCYVDSDAVTPVYRRQRGFANTAITRTGAGDYTLTLSDAIATAADGDIYCQLTINHTAFAFGVIELASTTTLRTRTATGTAVPAIAAADLDYWLTVQNFGPN